MKIFKYGILIPFYLKPRLLLGDYDVEMRTWGIAGRANKQSSA